MYYVKKTLSYVCRYLETYNDRHGSQEVPTKFIAGDITKLQSCITKFLFQIAPILHRGELLRTDMKSPKDSEIQDTSDSLEACIYTLTYINKKEKGKLARQN